MDNEKLILQLIQVHDLVPDQKIKSKLIENMYCLSRGLKDKSYLRSRFCKKCRVQIRVENKRTDCKCKRYVNIKLTS